MQVPFYVISSLRNNSAAIPVTKLQAGRFDVSKVTVLSAWSVIWHVTEPIAKRVDSIEPLGCGIDLDRCIHKLHPLCQATHLVEKDKSLGSSHVSRT